MLLAAEPRSAALRTQSARGSTFEIYIPQSDLALATVA
jgi:hypothetical protein